MKKYTFNIIFVLTLSIQLCFCQSGSLDLTFGNNGIIITDFEDGWDELGALEIQPDQKVIAVGWQGLRHNFIACRYNIDGSLDTSFAEKGFFVSNLPEIFANQACALQADGKIIITGTTTTWDIPTQSYLEDFLQMRLTKNGIPDSTFGIYGIVKTDVGGIIERIREIVIQHDGKILVAGDGFSETELGSFYAMARYETKGQLDTTFGNKGIKVIDEDFIVQTCVLQSDGKILIGGYADLGPSGDFEIRRFKSDGAYDDSFGDGGKVSTDISGQSDYIDGIIAEPDGRIFVSGGANFTVGSSDLAFARYLPNGNLDPNYGNNGFEIISVPTESRVTDLAKQPDGKYIMCGASNNLNGVIHSLLIRINHDGGLDETFGDQGLVFLNLQNRSDQVGRDLVIQGNNYIVLGGSSGETSYHDFTLARFIVDDVVAVKNQNVKASSLIVSPNPCKDFCSIKVGKANEEFHVSVSDLSGCIKMDKSIMTDAEGKLIIDTRSLQSGYYSFLIENKSMRRIVSIAVQN